MKLIQSRDSIKDSNEPEYVGKWELMMIKDVVIICLVFAFISFFILPFYDQATPKLAHEVQKNKDEHYLVNVDTHINFTSVDSGYFFTEKEERNNLFDFLIKLSKDVDSNAKEVCNELIVNELYWQSPMHGDVVLTFRDGVGVEHLHKMCEGAGDYEIYTNLPKWNNSYVPLAIQKAFYRLYRWHSIHIAKERVWLNPFAPTVLVIILALMFALAIDLYFYPKKAKSFRFWIQVFVTETAVAVFVSLFMACTFELDCQANALTVSRLSSSGISGRVWTGAMAQATGAIVVYSNILPIVYPAMKKYEQITWIMFAGISWLATGIIPQSGGYIAGVLHVSTTAAFTMFVFICYLPLVRYSYNDYRFHRIGVIRMIILVVMVVCTFVTGIGFFLFDLDYFFPNIFFWGELIGIFGIVAIWWTIAIYECSAVTITFLKIHSESLTKNQISSNDINNSGIYNSIEYTAKQCV